MMEPESVVSHFDRFTSFLQRLTAGVYPEPISASHDGITEAMMGVVLTRTGLAPGARVLDVGCGQGPALDRFRARGFAPIGITIGDADLAVCRQNGHTVHAMDQSFLDFPEASFDLLWARHAVEHSVAPLFTLDGFRRVLNPDGWLYMEVPAPDTACHHEQNPNHYSVLTKSAWSSLLMRAGFEIEETRDINLQTPAGPDVYWAFLCRCRKERAPVVAPVAADRTLYLGLAEGHNYGWGVCSRHLKEELESRIPVVSLSAERGSPTTITVPGKAMTGIGAPDFTPIVRMKGSATVAYTFLEFDLEPEAAARARAYDLVLCGSQWCRDQLAASGIHNTDVLLQGVDPRRFAPRPRRAKDGMFIVFSGGKFEYRKGQDLVLAAIRILQQKYKDIVLMNAWFNLWEEALATMQSSRHIRFRPEHLDWVSLMEKTYRDNGIDPRRVMTLPLVKHEELPALYAMSDIGIFPSRCEGGTNLVLMEYMACGRPAIVSWSSGHRDIINAENALLLKDLTPEEVMHGGKRIATWQSPSVDEIVAQVEYAYHHRDEIQAVGAQGATAMARLTWGAMADRLIDLLWGGRG